MIAVDSTAMVARWRASFVDAGPALADLFDRLHRADDPPVQVNRQPDVRPDELPALLDGAPIAIIDHTSLPTAVAARCPGLKHVVFLGTGARSYMDPEALVALGIAVHTIKGYGDTAVAECAFALMWAAARGLARMDRELREGRWQRTDGMQLHGKTLGLIGFGGIAQELARLALGAGMQVVAWNRSPREHAGVEFVGIDTLLATNHVVSLHLLLTDETRGFLSRERIKAMRDGAIAAALRAVLEVDLEHALEQLCPAHARWPAMRTVRRARRGLRRRSALDRPLRHHLRAQLGVGRQHAVKADQLTDPQKLTEDGAACVLRSKNDLMFEVDDVFDACTPYDHVHCAYSFDKFSSRIATALACSCQREGRADEANAVLRPIYERFTEGFDYPDLVHARAVLEGRESNQ